MGPKELIKQCGRQLRITYIQDKINLGMVLVFQLIVIGMLGHVLSCGW